MTEQKKPSGLGELISKAKAGAASLAAKKKPIQQDPATETEPTIGAVGDHENHEEHRPLIDDFNDSVLIDSQDQPETGKPAKKQWTTKKKVVLAAVAVCAVVMAKNGYFTPGAQHHAPAKESAATTPAKPADGFAQDQKGMDKGLDAGLPSMSESADKDPAVGQTLDQLRLEGPFQKPLESHEQMSENPPQTPPPGDGFGFPTSPSNEQAAPLTVSGPSPIPAPPAEHIVGGEGSSPFVSDASITPASKPVAAPDVPSASAPVDAASLFGSIPTPPPASAPAPIPAAAKPASEKGPSVLGSASFQNPDSSRQPSQQDSKADVTKLEAQIAQKDKQIKSLKDQLASKQAPKPTPAHAKQSVASAPKHSPAVAQRSTPRAVTPVAKIATRPKLCVKAVAPPARNCITCVAHAFVVDAGAENMVGQGDFLDGYRVSITGDRLDLQNSDGQVVHKFWSQPNGCPSI